MILRFLFFLFVFYLAYKLVFEFIIPVYRTTSRVKKGFREMHERMNQQSSQAQPRQPTSPKQDKSASHSEDYIDFEEIK